MPVDPSKPRQILVVHGVEAGSDEDQSQHLLVRDLILDRLNGIPVSFDTSIYRYENLNDQALGLVQELFGWVRHALIRRCPLAALAAEVGKDLADIVGDVLIARRNGPVAKRVRQGLKDRILQCYAERRPLYLLAHSLGSVYALDVIDELMRADGLFVRDQRRTWPVQALVTIGSPLGLGMFSQGRKLGTLGDGTRLFRWENFWSRTDPVVSGNFYGDPLSGYRVAERFATGKPDEGWIVQDHVVDTGFAWLRAHVAYWKSPEVGDALLRLITT